MYKTFSISYPITHYTSVKHVLKEKQIRRHVWKHGSAFFSVGPCSKIPAPSIIPTFREIRLLLKRSSQVTSPFLFLQNCSFRNGSMVTLLHIDTFFQEICTSIVWRKVRILREIVSNVFIEMLSGNTTNQHAYYKERFGVTTKYLLMKLEEISPNVVWRKVLR